MTNAHRSPDDLLAITQHCGYCLAAPGEWCRVARGRTKGQAAVWLHAERLWLPSSARWYGHTGSRVWTLREVLREIETAGQRWADLPADWTAAQLAALLQKRLAFAEANAATAANRIREEVPEEWLT